MNLSSRQLRAFIALVEERHFTRAAQRCHQTQPAFSALIRSLEEALGVRLFDRTTRKVELTTEGRLFQDAARRLLDDMDAAVVNLRDHAALRRGRVTVAALPSLAAGWLPAVYAAFHRDHPAVSLHLHDALLEPCLEHVRRGDADIAVAAEGMNMAGLATEPLCEDVFHLVCRKDHPLAGKRHVSLSDLGNAPIIQLGKGSSIRQSLARHAGFSQLRTFLEVDHLATVTGLVAAGLGVSLVPSMTLYQFSHPELAIVPLAGRARLKRSLFLIRRSDQSLSVAAQAFYDVLLRERRALQGVS